MDRLNFKIKFFFAASVLAILGMPAVVFGAAIVLDPGEISVRPGQSFQINILAETGLDCINAAQITVSFPPEIIQIADFGRGGSILTFWNEFPGKKEIAAANQSGSITFSGGIPGGYCSYLIKNRDQTGLLAKIEFTIPGAAASAKIENRGLIAVSESTRVYLNDGLGTEEIVTASSTAVLIDDGAPIIESAWEKTLKADKIPPEPFSIQIQRDENLFEGKYFAVFFTADKQSGIDYYEIIEENGGNKKSAPENWQIGKSPYILKDQSLKSGVRIRAIDKAGNIAEAAYSPPKEEKQIINSLILRQIASGAALASVLLFYVILIRTRKARQKRRFPFN